MERLDPREAELIAKVARCKEALVARSEALQYRLRSFDPREQVRRHPLQGILVSVAAGFLLSASPRRPRGKAQAMGTAAHLTSALGSLLLGFLPGSLTSLLQLYLSSQRETLPDRST